MSTQRELQIPPPRADRPPLRSNLFNVMQKATTTLTPLFPYMHRGAIVPTGALFIGGPEVDYGQFYHHNSVDEIIIAFVANGATLQTGQLYNGGRVHGVNSFLKDQKKAGSFALFTVTQRQFEEGPQPEAVSMLCTACRKELFRTEIEGSSPDDDEAAREVEHPLPTIAAQAAPLREFNETPAMRTCSACGHLNEPFPLSTWGWEKYAIQSNTMAAAKQVLLAADPAARPMDEVGT